MTQQSELGRIDSHTMLFGVIGDPIRHSKSPIMMNCAFREKGINAVYTAFHIVPNKLADFVAGVRAMDIRGVNVTIPHKLGIMELLDEIDEGAQAIGAVNTIVNRDGKLIGCNTDGIGYVRSLKEEAAPELADKRIVVIGAGGAARGVVYALAQEKPAAIAIANRSVERAEELAELISGRGAAVEAAAADKLELLCRDADIVINTTSVGMHPHTEASPIRAEWLKPGAVASDLIYNPLKTKFLLEAEERGCIAHGGLGMFIYQGAYAFEYWTGTSAPADTMRETVLEALRQ